MAELADLLLKIANNARLTSQELADLGRMANETQSRNSQVAGMFNGGGELKINRVVPENKVIEFVGDVKASGGDVYSNAMTNDQEDPHFVLMLDGVRKGELWFDRSADNVAISNNSSGGDVVVTVTGNTPSSEALVLYDVLLGSIAHGLGVQGEHKFIARSTDPSYVDGYTILYFYSSGGVDEVRVRGKVGATETQVTLANITP